MTFEDILEEVGGYGKFQRNLTYFFFIPLMIVIPLFWVNLILMVIVPDHWCNVPTVKSRNLSIELQRTIISPPEDPSCSMYDVNYTALLDYDDFVLSNDTKIVSCNDGWEYDKTDFESTIATQWNMVCDKSYYPSLILTMQKIGIFIGTPIFGFLSDKVGRKTILLVIACVVSAGEIACLLTNNVVVFAVLKLIPSSVLSTLMTVICIFCIELVPPERRAQTNGINNVAWTIGISIIPLIVYLARDWVILSLINAAGGLFILCYWKFVPESPCWLVSQGRYEEAVTIMKRIGDKNGKNPDELVLFKKLQALGEDIQKKKSNEKHSNFNLLKFPRLRRHFFILTFCYIANNVGYGGIIYNTRNLSGNIFINFFLLAVVEIPSNILFMVLMDRLGRRWTAMLGFLITGIVCATAMIDIPYIDIISSLVCKFMTSGTFMVTEQQASELYPTVTRTFGIGVGKTITTAITLFLPYIADLATYGKQLPFVVISLVCIIAAVLSSFLPETLNGNLPQTTTEAEMFGKDEKYFSWRRKKCSSNTVPVSIT